MLTQLEIIPFLDSSSEGVISLQDSQKSSVTPYGNTGSNRQNPLLASLTNSGEQLSPRFITRIHWLQGTFRFTEAYHIQLLVAALERIFDDKFALDGGAISRGQSFKFSGYSTLGIRLAWNPPTDKENGFCWLSFPGSVFDASDINNVIMLFDLLTDDYSPGYFIHHFKATRIDIAIDDLSKSVTTQMIHECALAGNFSGFRNTPYKDAKGNWKPPSYRFVQSPYVDESGQLHQASTINFGSRQSDKQFYVYDKWAESEGRLDSIRFEARFLDEQAHIRFLKILHTLQSGDDYEMSYFRLLGGMVTGAIDFVDRESSDRLSRCVRLEFWGQFIDDLGRIQLPVPRKKPTLQSTADWVYRQWKTSLAIFYRVGGLEDIMNSLADLISQGEHYLRPSHLALIAQATKEKFNLPEYLRFISA